MLVLLKTTKEQFEKVKADMIAARETDYYYVGEGRHSGKFIDGNEVNYPMIIKILLRYRDEKLWVKGGYRIADDHAFYSTCAGNIHGVVELDGAYMFVGYGRRSVVTSALMDIGATEGDVVVNLESHGPSEMYWYEEESSYLIRKGIETTLSRLAEEWYDDGFLDGNLCHVPSETSLAVWRHWENVYGTEKLETMVRQHILKSTHPEAYILDRFRNRKVTEEKINNGIMTKLAWSMLDQPTRDRILKYGNAY